MMKRKKTGNIGEKYAVSWLMVLGFKIEDTNFYTRSGEIDIIASYYNNDDEIRLFSFFEVKLRNYSSIGKGIFSINDFKKVKIVKTANEWIVKNGYCDSQINQFHGIILNRIDQYVNLDKNSDKVYRNKIFIQELDSWYRVNVYNLFD